MMFFEQVYRLRKESNLTQEDLAEKCEVSRQAVAKWESGESVPDIYKLIQIAKIFDISLDELVRGEKQQENQKEIARKIYLKFIENMESIRNGMQQLTGSDSKLAKELKILVKQSRLVFQKGVVEQLFALTDDFGIPANEVFKKEKYKDIMPGTIIYNSEKYCEFIIPEKYAKIEEIHLPHECPEIYRRLCEEKSFPVVQFDWSLYISLF